MTDFINTNIIYLIPIGVVTLLLILVLIGVALAKTAGYFVERFPKEELNQEEYFSYKAKAEQFKSEAKAYEEAIDRLRKEYEQAIKDAKEHLDDGLIKDNLQSQLEQVESNLEAVQSELSSNRNENYKIKSEISFLNNVLGEQREKKKNAERELSDLEEKISNLKTSSKELEKFQKELNSLQERSEKLNREYSSTKFSYDEMVKKQKELKEDEEKTSERRAKVEKLKSDIASKQKKFDSLSRDIAQSEIKNNLLNSKVNELEAQIEKLKQDHQKTSKDFIEGYKNLMDPPQSLVSFAKRATESNKFSESEVEELNKFNSYLEMQNYHFSSRVIKAFHTALKIQSVNPLTVLAGISGTGKTLLPTKYADYFGIYTVVLPVEPRWDSPQDLLGFYNYLEKKFQATELSKTLVALDNKNEFTKDPYIRTNDAQKVADVLSDRMVLVLLDEMNLARTEYYFANFLSRLELKRTVLNEADKSQRKKAEITIDDNFGSIWVPDNVLFVGTMNEDESTQTLSDKVLDRANLLRFGKPSKDTMNKESSNRSKERIHTHSAMDYSLYRKWIVSKENVDASLADNLEFVNNCVTTLNEAMSCIGKPFGFRVNDAIKSYVANYPKENEEIDVKLAIADQIEQKIMPKVRGIDLSMDSSIRCLDNIERVIDELNDDALKEAFDIVKNDEFNTGMFMWQGISR